MTFWANALFLTLRTEKATFCPGLRTWWLLTSDRMKGTLEPSAPSIIPNPCASIFLTIPIILSVPRVQDRSLQHLPWPPVEQETSLFIVLSRVLAQVSARIVLVGCLRHFRSGRAFTPGSA